MDATDRHARPVRFKYKMKLHFLGTGSSSPTIRRGVSATAVQLDDGSVWLFDCGEGTQIQLQRSSITTNRITNIFITHLHGDHLFGLPGLLCTKSSQTPPAENIKKGNTSSVVNIYGPEGIDRFITTSLAVSQSLLDFQFKIHELLPEPEQVTEECQVFEEGSRERNSPLLPNQLPGIHIRATKDSQGNASWLLRDDEFWRVEAGWVHHRVPTYGFVIRERNKPGSLNTTKLLSLGIPPGPVYGQLKAGRSVTMSDGRVVQPQEVTGPAIPGRTVVIIGDTKDASPLSHLLSGCDVIVHEATLDDTLKSKAEEFGHSTPSQAVNFAISVGAKTLLLNHFSQRYFPAQQENSKRPSVAILQEQAEAAADSTLHVQCAEDLFVFEVPNNHQDE